MVLSVFCKFCFESGKTKQIYRGCNKEYQLNESGDLHIPCEATNEYCNGPCLSETKTLLSCIDKLASNFLFLNRATTQLIGNVLDTGCRGYTNQRGTSLTMQNSCIWIKSSGSIVYVSSL